MNRPEFEEWLGYHFTLFKSCLDNWYKKMTRDQKKSALHAWHGVLENTELEDAKKASACLLGEPKKVYATHSEWPQRVKQKAMYIREERISEENSRECHEFNLEQEAKRKAKKAQDTPDETTIRGVPFKDGVPF